MSAGPPAGTQAAPAPPTEMEKMRLEIDSLKATLLANAAAQAQARPSQAEETLRKELADLRAASSNSAPVAEHLAREALYKREPYKATLDRQRAKLAGYAAGLGDDAPTRDGLFKEFALAARGGGLSPQDAVLLHGLLSPTLFRIKLAKAILINSAPASRAALFNTLVLGEAPPTFEDAYGEVVSQIPWPLFPVRPEFGELNADLLREATAILEGSSAVRGAGPTADKKKKVPRVFANPAGQEAAHLLEIVRGSGYAPVADGRADLSEVEAAFNFMAGEIADLRNQIASLKGNNGGGRGRGRGRGRGKGGRGNQNGWNQNGYNQNGYNHKVRGGGAADEESEEGN